jgi:iron complex outermembrane receptor protein
VRRQLAAVFLAVVLTFTAGQASASVPGGAPTVGQSAGAISGRVVRNDGSPLSGVMVVLRETGAVEWTATDGTYRFPRVRPGTYTVLLTLGGYSTTESLSLSAGTAAPSIETKVDWPLSFVESMVVAAPSRQTERLADAPAAVTSFDAADIARRSGNAQLPLLLASSPGIQVAQSGLFDFNVNARGFNELVNRRVRTELDGRETSLPHVMGYTDWATVASALGEFEQIEFVRGPGGALYGMGALNGVLSLRSRTPASSLGGKVRMTFGELDTARIDVRQAGALGGGWFFKAIGGFQRSADFAVSRTSGAEYASGVVPSEVVPLASDHPRLAYGSARLDKQFAGDETLVLEAGTAHKNGQVTLTNLGRFQTTGSDFPWARAEYRTSRWRLMSAVTGADIDDQIGLGSGSGTYQSGYNLQFDAQTNRAFQAGRGRMVAGASYGRQRVDSADATGAQTIFDRPESAASGSIFGQVDYDVRKKFKGSAAVRVDANSLTRTTVSPRVAAIFEFARAQRLRVAFSDAFKAPTLAETRLRAPVGAPIDLSVLESALAPVLGGTRLGFQQIPFLAVGNEHLGVEEVRSFETGYSAVLAQRTFLQAVYYRNHHSKFTSGLLPQVGTSLGRLNPTFGPYRPPETLSASAAAAVQAAVAAALPPNLSASLSNLRDGRPVFAFLSLGNFGVADTQGLELSALAMLPEGWRLDASYTWFDFSIEADSPETRLSPNTPAHQVGLGLTYVSPRFDAGARYRWVDAFDWVSGLYDGRVPAYAIVDAQANVPITPRLAVGVDVSNLFDNAHYEMFGGDILRRRALAHLTVGW